MSEIEKEIYCGTIFHYFSNFSVNEIIMAINCFPEDFINKIKSYYGDDLSLEFNILSLDKSKLLEFFQIMNTLRGTLENNRYKESQKESNRLTI